MEKKLPFTQERLTQFINAFDEINESIAVLGKTIQVAFMAAMTEDYVKTESLRSTIEKWFKECNFDHEIKQDDIEKADEDYEDDEEMMYEPFSSLVMHEGRLIYTFEIYDNKTEEHSFWRGILQGDNEFTLYRSVDDSKFIEGRLVRSQKIKSYASNNGLEAQEFMDTCQRFATQKVYKSTPRVIDTFFLGEKYVVNFSFLGKKWIGSFDQKNNSLLELYLCTKDSLLFLEDQSLRNCGGILVKSENIKWTKCFSIQALHEKMFDFARDFCTVECDGKFDSFDISDTSIVDNCKKDWRDVQVSLIKMKCPPDFELVDVYTSDDVMQVYVKLCYKKVSWKVTFDLSQVDSHTRVQYTLNVQVGQKTDAFDTIKDDYFMFKQNSLLYVHFLHICEEIRSEFEKYKDAYKAQSVKFFGNPFESLPKNFFLLSNKKENKETVFDYHHGFTGIRYKKDIYVFKYDTLDDYYSLYKSCKKLGSHSKDRIFRKQFSVKHLPTTSLDKKMSPQILSAIGKEVFDTIKEISG